MCVDAREDADGFEDSDGCPELDNDGDGILDAKDQCPLEPETKNGFQDEDGCPDKKLGELMPPPPPPATTSSADCAFAELPAVQAERGGARVEGPPPALPPVPPGGSAHVAHQHHRVERSGHLQREAGEGAASAGGDRLSLRAEALTRTPLEPAPGRRRRRRAVGAASGEKLGLATCALDPHRWVP
jgi:hypothetical protein